MLRLSDVVKGTAKGKNNGPTPSACTTSGSSVIGNQQTLVNNATTINSNDNNNTNLCSNSGSGSNYVGPLAVSPCPPTTPPPPSQPLLPTPPNTPDK